MARSSRSKTKDPCIPMGLEAASAIRDPGRAWGVRGQARFGLALSHPCLLCLSESDGSFPLLCPHAGGMPAPGRVAR